MKCRHYKALMRKNWINWKRTLCGSIAELMAPLVLIGLLGSLRGLFIPEFIESEALYKDAALMSPMTIRLEDDDFAENLKRMTDFNADLIWFSGRTSQFRKDYENSDQENDDNCQNEFYSVNSCREWRPTVVNETYMKFNYQHCYESKFRPGLPDSTIVAIVHNETKLGYMLEKEVNRMYTWQKEIWTQRADSYVKNQGKPLGSILRDDKDAREDIGFEPLELEVQNFTKKQDLLDLVLHPDYRIEKNKPGVCFAVLIQEVDDGDSGYNIEIMMNDQFADRFQSMPYQQLTASDDYVGRPDEQAYAQLTQMGFAQLQNWIANFALRLQFDEERGSKLPTISNLIIPMKVSSYLKDDFGRVLDLLSFFLFLTYIVPLYRITYRIVNEKETRARESMKMMGLTDSSYWLSWATFYALIVTLISFIIVYQLKPVVKTDQKLLFLLVWIYGMSLFGYALIVQSFFDKARTAGGFAAVVYFIASFFDNLINQPGNGYWEKLGVSFLSPVAINRCVYVLSVAEQGSEGLTWQNISTPYQNFVVRDGMIMMVISGIVMSIIGLYLDNIVQSQFGSAKPWNFCCKSEFWGCGKTKSRKNVQPGKTPAGTPGFFSEDFYMDKTMYEPVINPELLAQESEQNILRIQGLKKHFGDFKAVNGVNLNLYKGQIFALLGHNGAGKSTTISMLTGLIQASAGSAQVFDKDLFEEMDDVRQFMGVCPQHDVLFDLLTPEEHLDVFCDFKGVPKNEKKAQIDQIIKDIDLGGMRKSRAHELSGGNRRKLSIAIALIGDSKFILLDEPTAGIDLSGRRKMWDMLKKYKNGRIIILTTHYMDEADILGDRVGIMAHGQITCLGRSLFLKNRFGVGYRLNMVKKDKETNIKIADYIREHLGPEVQKLSEISSEVTFQIPRELSDAFKVFFENFDMVHESLGILSYGISVTTLEEVFLSVGHGVKEEQEGSTNDKALEDSDLMEEKKEESLDDIDKELAQFRSEAAMPYNTGMPVKEKLVKPSNAIPDYSLVLFFEQIFAILRRRTQIYMKNKSALIFEILVPVFLVCIGLSFSKVDFFRDSPDRILQPSEYPLSQKILFNESPLKKADEIERNIDIQDILDNLPDFEDSFTLQPFENKVEDNQENYLNALKEFDNQLFSIANDEKPYRYGSFFILEANNDTRAFKIATFVNTTSQDASIYFPQFIYEAILRSATGNKDYQLNVTSSPFPVGERLKGRQSGANAIFISIISGIGFALIPSSVIGFIVQEKEKGLKQIQVVSGLSLGAYWIANFIFDSFKTLCPCVLTIASLYIFDMGYDDCWLTILVYPLGVVPFSYMVSFMFNEEGAAQTLMLFTNVTVGSIGAIAVFVLRIIPGTIKYGDLANNVLKIFPNFSITNSIIYDASKTTFNSSREQLLDDEQGRYNDIGRVTLEPMELGNTGGDIAALTAHCVIGMFMVLLIELSAALLIKLEVCCRRNSLGKVDSTLEPDEDVLAEEERVAKLDASDCLVKVHGLRKVFKGTCRDPLVAIQGTSFAVDKGECFALLGVNGAGKTTTFKSLTRDCIPTAGKLTVLGYDINRQFDSARHFIGYCPQYDTIFDLLTVQEHLEYQAIVKGIPIGDRAQGCYKSMKNLNLMDYADKCAGTLSGGNKRKLSVAMALLGNPAVILLDEPSAGMDPEARRFMWGVVANASQQKKTSGVIITTHSMEEAEALSTKMGIQVKGGVFRCFGSSQHIKNKFATGYEIEAKFKNLTEEEVILSKRLLGLSKEQERMHLDDFRKSLTANKADDYLLTELSLEGFGSELVQDQFDDGSISIQNAIQWLHTETFGLQLLKFLAIEFGEVEILEHVVDFFKLRVPKGNKTIGYTFGALENEKSRIRVSEYSVSQTTLEQIFQRFAKVNIDGPEEKQLFKADAQTVTRVKTKGEIAEKETSIEESEWANSYRAALMNEDFSFPQEQTEHKIPQATLQPEVTPTSTPINIFKNRKNSTDSKVSTPSRLIKEELAFEKKKEDLVDVEINGPITTLHPQEIQEEQKESDREEKVTDKKEEEKGDDQ